MTDDFIYRELQRDLDRLPVGFPSTESGVELRILRQLFSPLEARITLQLSMWMEPVAAIHKRLSSHVNRDALRSALDDMAFRGLIRRDAEAGGPRYGKLPFVVGIFEGQVDRMTPQLASDFVEYFDRGLGQAVRPKSTNQLRVVPVNRRIPAERGVSRYDDIRATVRGSEGPFAVMNCICRQAKDLIGDPCRQTKVRENCLTIGSAATLMVEHGRAQFVPRERTLELLDQADSEGLVLQPQNTRKPMFICLCCGCCCVALNAAKKLEKPADFFNTNYFVASTTEECAVCGVCVDRCQMNAISLTATSATVDATRCMGCGLCVSTCPTGAMVLHRNQRPAIPPEDTSALYARIYRERYGTADLAVAAARFLARRYL